VLIDRSGKNPINAADRKMTENWNQLVNFESSDKALKNASKRNTQAATVK
jgi:hypothetical protein